MRRWLIREYAEEALLKRSVVLSCLVLHSDVFRKFGLDLKVLLRSNADVMKKTATSDLVVFPSFESLSLQHRQRFSSNLNTSAALRAEIHYNSGDRHSNLLWLRPPSGGTATPKLTSSSSLQLCHPALETLNFMTSVDGSNPHSNMVKIPSDAHL